MSFHIKPRIKVCLIQFYIPSTSIPQSYLGGGGSGAGDRTQGSIPNPSIPHSYMFPRLMLKRPSKFIKPFSSVLNLLMDHTLYLLSRSCLAFNLVIDLEASIGGPWGISIMSFLASPPRTVTTG